MTTPVIKAVIDAAHLISKPPLLKIKVIHGEDELCAFVSSVTELTDWAESNKIFVAYFPVDIDRMPSFANCRSDYVLRPLFVGNYAIEDQPKIIELFLKQIPGHVRVEKGGNL